ncbi:MAG: DUF6056 family protein [Lachnospiraceae bacterium]|nr:DUF6056 family protein [Lachnospiraceae bacterium]
MSRKTISRIAAVLCILAALGVFFAASRSTHFMMDDLSYATNINPDSPNYGQPVSSVKDIVESQVWHYFNWGGRTVAHVVLQFLLWSGEIGADIFNTIALSLLCVFLVGRKRKLDLWMIVLSFGMMISTNPNWHQSLLWQSATANYLYMMLLCIPFTGLYLRKTACVKDEDKVAGESVSGKGKCPKWLCATGAALGMFVWGVLSGWTNENIGPTVFLITVAVIVFLFKRKIKVPVWMYTGSVGTVIGSAAMILAPGNGVRMEYVEDHGSFIKNMIARASTLITNSETYLFSIFIMLLMVYICYRLLFKKLPSYEVILLGLAAIVSDCAMFLSPHYPDRAGFGSMVFALWAVLKMLAEIFEQSEKSERFKIAMSLFFWAAGVTLLGIYL